MSENQVEEKKGWSWLGFFFAPYYYAGYGDLQKGIIFAVLAGIPFVALIVGIYGGLKAKQELPIKQQNFQWKNVGIAVVINFIVLVAIQLIMA